MEMKQQHGTESELESSKNEPMGRTQRLRESERVGGRSGRGRWKGGDGPGGGKEEETRGGSGCEGAAAVGGFCAAAARSPLSAAAARC